MKGASDFGYQSLPPITLSLGQSVDPTRTPAGCVVRSYEKRHLMLVLAAALAALRVTVFFPLATPAVIPACKKQVEHCAHSRFRGTMHLCQQPLFARGQPCTSLCC